MVFNLDPLDITLDFERRPYRLGDTINATVTLIPNSDVEVRAASLSLCGQVRRTEVHSGRAVNLEGQPANVALTGRVSGLPTQPNPSHTVSPEVFYSSRTEVGESLRKNVISRHDVALKLDPKLQKLQRLSKERKGLSGRSNSSLSIEPWWLEVQVDIVMGRDTRVRRDVEIIAPLSSTT